MSVIVLQQTQADRDALSIIKIDPAVIADDHADYKDVTVKKPWGFERQVYKTAASCVWRLSVASRCETSMHCHPHKTAVMICSEGRAIVQTLNGKHAMQPGDVIIIEPGVFHRTFACVACVMVEIEWPPNRNDLIRMADIYGRVGAPYEGAKKAAGI